MRPPIDANWDMSWDDAVVASAGEGQGPSEGSVLPTAARVVAARVGRSDAVDAGGPAGPQWNELGAPPGTAA